MEKAAMPPENVRRRLATILAADVVGYSRLMRADEEGTLAAVTKLRREVVAPRIAAGGGRIFKLMGDGLLAEFPSVVDAARVAVDIQRALADGAGKSGDGVPMSLRIGLHLGDVIVDGDDLQGDGVNLAARLEGLAEPGGLCISGAVHEQVRDRIDLAFEDLGERSVKNIDRPVRVWAWRSGGGQAAVPAPAEPAAARRRPAIVVLPFANLSSDPEQEYFADGMVEEITTGLARMRWLTVISRNSAFAYKGRAVDVRRVGRELSVGYLVEGSVRKAGGSVRISAQLINAETGAHLWGQAFTGALDDIFDLQDEVTTGIISAVEPSLRQAEIDRAKRWRQENLDAYDLYLRALDQAHRFTPEARANALALLDTAIAIDPEYAEAHGVAAFCRQQRYLWGGRDPEDRKAALRHAEAVAAARTDDAGSLAFAAMSLSALDGQHDAAMTMLARALDLAPNSALALTCRSLVEMILGRPEESALHAARSLRLSPLDPLRHIPECALAVARLAAGDMEAALRHARRAVDSHPIFTPGLTTLALCLVEAGRTADAVEVVDRILAIAPDTRVSNLHERFLLANGVGFDRVATALRAAGLPE
jgi:adenylate cyclase